MGEIAHPHPCSAGASASGSNHEAAVPALEQRIEAEILLGSLNAGEWLRLVDMEERYAASRFEVRTALARLAAIKVLEHVPNRGYRVVVVTDDEAKQRIEIRLLLELPASELVLQRATPGDCDALRELALRFSWAIENATVSDLDLTNHRFHRTFIRLCGNPQLERLINELRERTRPSGWSHWKTVSHSRESAVDHLTMVDALEARDAARLRHTVRRHILRLGPAPRDEFLQSL